MAGGAVLSAFMQVLFERLSTTALHEFRSVRGIKNELENLSSTLSTIQVLLEDAEEKQLKDKCVRDWLAKLKDVAYDLDDLLDGHAAEALRSQLEGNQSHSRWKRQVCHFLSCTFWQKSLFHRMIAHRIRRVQEKLGRIAEERDILGLQALGGISKLEITERQETSSLVDGLNVFGREEDRDCCCQAPLFSRRRRRRGRLRLRSGLRRRSGSNPVKERRVRARAGVSGEGTPTLKSGSEGEEAWSTAVKRAAGHGEV